MLWLIVIDKRLYLTLLALTALNRQFIGCLSDDSISFCLYIFLFFLFTIPFFHLTPMLQSTLYLCRLLLLLVIASKQFLNLRLVLLRCQIQI